MYNYYFNLEIRMCTICKQVHTIPVFRVFNVFTCTASCVCILHVYVDLALAIYIINKINTYFN